MELLLLVLLAVASLLLTLFSYLMRLHEESGRFLIHGSKDNVEFFEEHVQPKLGTDVEQAAWALPLLAQLNLIALGLIVGAWNLGKPFEWSTILEEAVFLLLDVPMFGLVIPNVLLSRTKGKWLRAWMGTLRVSVLLVYPLVAVCQFLHRIAMLGGPLEEEEQAAPSPSENIEALIEAGEEEGLLEKEDRRLIQSVVEFGGKTVREVMTPRPGVFAVCNRTTLAELEQMLATRRYTRIPVYEGGLDHIVGFVHSGDLFAIEDAAAERRTVSELLRPIPFVPETKRISELLPELQQKPQIAMVVDEYGSVAGLVTVEDMVEEIVGEIRDEHEPSDVIRRADGRYEVPGGLDLGRLEELFGTRLQETGDARTVSGLVMDALGHVPIAGETLERGGLSFQVTEANGRRVIRMIVSGPAPEPHQPEAPSEFRSEQPVDRRAPGPWKPAA